MARQDLVSQCVDKLMGAIADSTFPPGSVLPKEADLADFLEVSRPTMREAIRVLTVRGITSVVHGRGTYVEPLSKWRDLGALVELLSQDLKPAQVGSYLVEIRRMIEVGSCGHAARRATDEDLAAMRKVLAEYDLASAAGKVDKAAALDVEFHDLILRATHNPFLGSLFQPLREALLASRVLTTQVPEVRLHAAVHHRRIFAAIAAGKEQQAKDAMRLHMDQTATDIGRYL